MTEANSPTTPSGSGARGVLLALLATLLLVLGFTLVSSLSAAVSANRYWMLGCGLFVCFVLPVILASWIRGIRRRRQEDGSGPVRRPSSVGTIALTNLALILGGSLLAPTTSATHLEGHGAWWVESSAKLVGAEKDNPVVRGAQQTTSWLASLLPGGSSTLPSTGGDGAVASASDGGATVVAAGPDASPDSAPTEPIVAGEVRLRYERRGSAVIIPVTLHGPERHTSVKMLFDTGATLTTLNAATLHRLGLGVSPDDPTIVTHTAAGEARRSITTIEGVTLAVARIPGGVTVAVCEPCARGEVVGLLGLNVLRHFKVTLDDEAGQVVLKQRRQGDPKGDLADIRPFIKLSNAKGVWRGPMLTVTVTLHNRSPRRLRYVKLVAEIQEGDKTGRIWGEVRDVVPRARTHARLEGLSPVKGKSFQLKLSRADW